MCHSLSVYSIQRLPAAPGGAASLTVRACDYGFRNEPRNKTDYCGDTNLRILTTLAKSSATGQDSSAWVCSDKVGCCSNFSHAIHTNMNKTNVVKKKYLKVVLEQNYRYLMR